MIIRSLLGVLLLVSWVAGSGLAQDDRDAGHSLSPFFYVQSDDPSTDRLPLKSTAADVRIAGIIDDVTVTQTYRNEGTRALEAIYIFPASIRTAVYAMIITIGERTVVVRIREKQQARQEYEAAKHSGRSVSRLEQHRPNVFQLNVANVLPGDEIRVVLAYTELLIPTEGIYEFVYPAVIGPRYVGQAASDTQPAEHWTANPYLNSGKPSPCAFAMKVQVDAGLPIQDIRCASHEVTIDYEGDDRATIGLVPRERTGGNRSFILQYRLAGETIRSGLLLARRPGENFFLLTIQPPRRITPAIITPREYIFVLDVSGSMHGFPLATAKSLMRQLLDGLRPSDRFNILLFAGSSQIMAVRSVSVNTENLAMATKLIDNQAGGGGTELVPALRQALDLPAYEGCSRSIVVISDGYVDVENGVFRLIRNNLHKANVFAFGIGGEINRWLIESLARAGMGEPFVVTGPEEAATVSARFSEYLRSPVLTRVKLEFAGFDAYDVEPARVPDLLAERPVTVYGKWRGDAAGVIRMNGLAADCPYESTLPVDRFRMEASLPALRNLWARHRIAQLADEYTLQPTDPVRAAITGLGLRYALLTPFTSVVAVDEVIRRKDGEVQQIKQPLPQPEGVSETAVGEYVPTTPEPEAWSLILLALGAVGWLMLRRWLS
ncbi:MAG TPA: VIT domain-containing protein [Acidobacteriota bacterium]|nr:VIT domain-containing protein [Acidobacteriota bacterium]HQF86237.1 VIT domain-containing protein [Acidobacteriota bacterium]HQG90519.1 VIT domain-containing protein [Acidobacteriota bacterium]HQK88791.1 VIT domain-containing protein [Acidobacteriota bacterium]